MTEETVFSDNIQIDPFPMVQVLEFSMKHQLNDHAYITCSGIISEENHDSYVSRISSGRPIEVTASKQLPEGERTTFFAGRVQDIHIHKRSNVYHLELQAVSATIVYDIERKSRSFQQIGINYDQLLKQIISPYPNANIINPLAQGQKVEQLLVQHEETTWEFMKRIASRMGGSIVGHVQLEKPWLYFGLPGVPSQGELIAHDYDLHHDFLGFEKLTKNTDHHVFQSAFSNYKITSRQLHYLGDQVVFQGQEQQIIDVKRKLTNGLLLNTYLLGEVQITTRQPILNTRLNGLSLNGVVRAVRSDQVQIQLDIDDNPQASYWFTHSTTYTSDNNVGIYWMPEEGDCVRVYFPTTNEREAYAISAVRTAGSDLDPNVKILKHPSGATIILAPDRITIIHGDSTIVLKEGIEIQSNGNITMSGQQNINIEAHQILMDAAEQIKLSVNYNSVTIDGAIVLSGTDVKMN